MLRTHPSMANLADRIARKHGDKIFMQADTTMQYEVIQGDTITFKEALRVTNILANAMRDNLGIQKGDRIAIVLTNIPEFGLVCGAALKVGAIPVPFNYMHKADELEHGINDCGAKVLITEKDLFDWNIGDKAELPSIEHWILTGPKKDVPEGFISFDDLMEGSTDRGLDIETDPDDVVGIFYTSGTTGRPKGAMLTSRNLIVPVTRSVRLLHVTSRDVAIVVLPLAHIFGFVTQFIAGLITGASGYLMRYFDARKVLENIEEHRGTIFAGVPAMYHMMLGENPEGFDLSSMRLWISGADAMPVENIKKCEALSGRFIEGYGMVETASLISVNLPFLRRAGSIGIPVIGVRVKIMDEHGNFAPRGETGELVVKGPCVMKGYWNNDDANLRTFTRGWMRTGDMGWKDRLGYIYFADRAKDVIKCGGYSIFSREVEEKMLSHPKIYECALVGAPHPEKGEIPVAFVQLEEGVEATPDELLEWCRENIAAYKAPRRIEIVPHLPLNMTMKVLKRELRDMLA